MGTATGVYQSMRQKIKQAAILRRSEDRSSPSAMELLECYAFTAWMLQLPSQNVVGCKSIDLKWAVANLLHFFAGTEEAGMLRRYNRFADRFLTGDRWIGAYGAIAMPQVQRCIQKLRESPHSRRAYVDMGPLAEEDLNRPPCWNSVHFLLQDDRLHAHVYQRSLKLAVMPYDCVVLTELLRFVAIACAMPIGDLRWTVGSCHATAEELRDLSHEPSVLSIQIPYEVLSSPELCLQHLREPTCDAPFLRWLREEGEVRS